MATSTKKPTSRFLKESEDTTSNKGRIIIRKKKPFLITEHKMFRRFNPFIKTMTNLHKSTMYIRSTIFGKQVIWGIKCWYFDKRKSMQQMKFMFIFPLVKKDALKYLDKHAVKKNKWLPSQHFNKNPNLKKEIVGTDIDSAYWNIAYNLGIIGENTWQHGQRVPDKNLLLASLSSLGTDKHFNVYKDGKRTKDIFVIKGDDRLKEVYKFIRFTCFKHMRRLAKMLGRDYIAYKTDCIYYIKTKKNIKLVQDYLDSHNLEYKMMTEEFDGTMD